VFEELLAHLDEAGVRFVVVGGLAVVIQGYARLTADIDLVIDLESANVQRAVDALTARGLRPLLPVNARDFANESIRREWVETRNLEVFSMRDERNPLLTVDLFAREPIPFEDLWSRADSVTVGGRAIRVACIDDLIRRKRAAARPQDVDNEWRGDFRSAEDRLLDASLSATPSQRLRWLEEALAFAAKMGALPILTPDTNKVDEP